MSQPGTPALQIVTGKGGVGKSTFAAALALAAARTGRRVLAIELGAPAGLAALLGAQSRGHAVPTVVEPNLEVVCYDGEAALAEYVRRRVPLAPLANAIVSHPLYRAFVHVGPGVRELMAIGRVRDELLGLATGRPRYDLLVLDAGASGHALQLLRMPGATARAFAAGLAHREAARVAATLADPAITAVHVVALPEQLALVEAAEVVERLRSELGLPVGRLVINQCRSDAPPGVDAALAALVGNPDPGAQALRATASRALGWLRLQQDGIAALEQRVGLPAERVPRLADEPFGRAAVERLAAGLRPGGE